MSGHMAIRISGGIIAFPIRVCHGLDSDIQSNFRIEFLSLYNKDFGEIVRFLGNDLATVPIAAFCCELLSLSLVLGQK